VFSRTIRKTSGTMKLEDHMDEPEAQERGLFFVVQMLGTPQIRYAVMSEPEIMEDESVLLASGGFDTRAEAEAALRQGIADGTYKPEVLLG